MLFLHPIPIFANALLYVQCGLSMTSWEIYVLLGNLYLYGKSIPFYCTKYRFPKKGIHRFPKTSLTVHTVFVVRHINCKYIEKVAKTITIGSHYLVYVRKDYYILKEGVCLRQIRMFKTAVKNVFKIKANYWFMTQLPVNKSCLAWHITTRC